MLWLDGGAVIPLTGNGNIWISSLSGRSRTYVLNLGSFGAPSSGPKRTFGAAEPDLYAYWREGDAFTYAIPVPNGKWRVTIHSFEPRTEGTDGQSMAITTQGRMAVVAAIYL
jgi:hypothetical protein